MERSKETLALLSQFIHYNRAFSDYIFYLHFADHDLNKKLFKNIVQLKLFYISWEKMLQEHKKLNFLSYWMKNDLKLEVFWALNELFIVKSIINETKKS